MCTVRHSGNKAAHSRRRTHFHTHLVQVTTPYQALTHNTQACTCTLQPYSGHGSCPKLHPGLRFSSLPYHSPILPWPWLLSKASPWPRFSSLPYQFSVFQAYVRIGTAHHVNLFPFIASTQTLADMLTLPLGCGQRGGVSVLPWEARSDFQLHWLSKLTATGCEQAVVPAGLHPHALPAASTPTSGLTEACGPAESSTW